MVPPLPDGDGRGMARLRRSVSRFGTGRDHAQRRAVVEAVLAQVDPGALRVATRRLAEEGVLKRREERGATWYSLAAPLFRFWLESRFDPWERTRIGLAISLIEAQSSPDAHPPAP